MDAQVDPSLTSIVIVAADSGPPLRAGIASALASKATVEVILVDNASGDGEIERAEASHAADPRFRVVRNGANLGFGPACNRGAAIARGGMLIFLNPDCELPADGVEQLREILRTESNIGMMGLTVCTAGGLPARSNRRRDPTLMRAFASMTGLARLEGRCPKLAGVEMPTPTGPLPPLEAVEAVSGACMVLPSDVFRRVGGFDEGYFLHVEDLDLCRRVRDAGYRVVVATAVRAVHAQGSSSRHRPFFVARHKRDGMWRYFLKFDPAAKNPLLRGCVRLGIWANWLLTVLKLAAKQVLTPSRRR